MIKYIDGNVLDHQCKTKTILVHVNNDAGGWGSGFVVPLGQKYPLAEKSYRDWAASGWTKNYSETGWIPFSLGKIQLVDVDKNLTVGNMVAQSTPGGATIKIGNEEIYLRPLRLECLRECLLRVAAAAKHLKAEVIGPAFGGGLAGGDFKKEIAPIIEDCICKYNIPVTIYMLK